MALVMVLVVSGCSTQYPNQALLGKQFPSVTGESLEQQSFTIPDDFNNPNTLLLIGYKQDRWRTANRQIMPTLIIQQATWYPLL